MTHGRAEVQAAMSRLTGALTRSLQSSPPRRSAGYRPTNWHAGGWHWNPLPSRVEVSAFEITSFSAPLAGISCGLFERDLRAKSGSRSGSAAGMRRPSGLSCVGCDRETSASSVRCRLEQATAADIIPLEDLLPKLPRIEIDERIDGESGAAWESDFRRNLHRALRASSTKKASFSQSPR